MKLIDLLSVIADDVIVVIWKDNEVVSVYDGKDSIDEHYNNETIKQVWAGNFKIDVEI